MDMNTMLPKSRVPLVRLTEVHTFIYAWASVLPSYLERQCEGLKVWDSNKSDSHAFIVYTPLMGIRGNIHY